MTLETLKQYQALKKEITELNKQLKGCKIIDSVQGSMHDYPYTMQSHKIEGYSPEAQYLLELRNTARRQIGEIEKYIAEIENCEIRRIFRLKFIEGKTNQSIASSSGYTDEGTVRKKIKKFLDFSGFSDLNDL